MVRAPATVPLPVTRLRVSCSLPPGGRGWVGRQVTSFWWIARSGGTAMTGLLVCVLAAVDGQHLSGAVVGLLAA